MAKLYNLGFSTKNRSGGRHVFFLSHAVKVFDHVTWTQRSLEINRKKYVSRFERVICEYTTSCPVDQRSYFTFFCETGLSYSNDFCITEMCTVLFHMSVESCIHRSLNFALKVHQIDAFNFNI